MLNKTVLTQLLSVPTAPYREELVRNWLTAELNASGVPHFQDTTGNLVLGAADEQSYLRLLAEPSEEPLRLFIAHMDHPGFHGVKWKRPGLLEAKWYGGSPTKFLVGAGVWLSDRTGQVTSGVVKSAKLNKAKSALDSLTVQIKGESAVAAQSLWGGFGFRAPVWNKGKIFYTKAADDLVGAYAILETAKYAVKSQKRNFIGLLTRAEEVGFIGCIAHFAEGHLSRAKRPVVAVSLETSRTLPGALIGEGPVVRLGDRANTFTPAALEVLTQIAKRKLKKYQRRVMDGGTCEATVAVSFRLPCVGISIPLGNYHNQSFQGGPGSRGALGPAPEFVHADDITGMLTLCRELLAEDLPWSDPWQARRAELGKWLKDAERLL